MTLIFPAIGQYEGFRWTLTAAARNCNCRVIVLGESPLPSFETVPLASVQPSDFADVASLLSSGPGVREFELKTLLRWLYVQRLLESINVEWPVWIGDWDQVFFCDLPKAYAPFKDADIASCFSDETGDNWSCAYGIRTKDVLDLAIHELRLAASSLKIPHGYQDMMLWGNTVRKHSLRRMNLSADIGGSTFDANMHTGGARYLFDGPAKALVKYRGAPHFVALNGPRLVRANCIHCWGSYKNKPESLWSEFGETKWHL